MKPKLKKYARYGLGLALIGVIAVASNRCSHPKKNDTTVSVNVATVVLGHVTPQIDTIGTAVAYHETDIKSQVTGQLKQIAVKAGQLVQPNQVLFVIDPAPFQASLAQAEATLHKDQALAAFSLQQLNRYSRLTEKGYVSKDFYSQVLANAKTAKAAVEADQAQVRNAQLALDHCTITAPIQGRLGNIVVNVGDVISADGDTALVSIKQFSPIEVQFTLPAKEVALVKQTFSQQPSPVSATSSDDPHLQAQGRIDFIDNGIDANTSTITLKALFDNSHADIWPGQLLQIHLTAPTQGQVLTIPNEAIQQNQQGGFYVYTVGHDHRAHLKAVTLGASTDQVTAIVSGLQLNEQVVTQGQFRLTDGTPVTIV